MKDYFKSAFSVCFASLVGFSATSSTIQAYDMSEGQCCPSTVYLSSPCYSFDFDFQALYLQPSSSSLDYASEAQPLPAPSPNWRIFDVHPDYHFGFMVGLGGVCHESSTNYALTWEHFHSKDHASEHVAISTNMMGPLFEIGPDAKYYKNAKGHATFNFDEINLDYGLFVNFGSRLRTNLKMGVSGAQIKQSVYAEFSNDEGTITKSVENPARFLGAGPQLGLDFSYCVFNGFDITGGAAASILVGSQTNHTVFKTSSPEVIALGITPPNLQTTKQHRRTQVVPAFEGKVGLAYNCTLCESFEVSFEAGYQAQIYLNAIQSMDLNSEVALNSDIENTIGVYARTFRRTLSNFALAGPYLNLNVGF